MSLNIITCNVRGLADAKKRRQIFHYLVDHKVDVAFIQETHSTVKTSKLWRNLWGGEAFFSHGESNARGVCTLIRKGLNVKVVKQENVIQGRVLNVTIMLNEQKILMSNVYAPNELDVAFFEQTFAAVQKDDCDHIVIGGDINVALQEVDRYPKEKFVPSSVSSFILDFMEEFSWVDVWRFAHPETAQYTWSKRSPIAMSRLDTFICPLSTLSTVTSCEILPSILSDHSFVKIVIQIEKIFRGRSYWKFNNALLNDKVFLDEMNQIIDKYKIETEISDQSQFWEGLKITMQNFAMDFGKLNAQNRRKVRIELTKKLNTQEKRLACVNMESPEAVKIIERINGKIDAIKVDLEKEYKYKAEGAAKRARVRWYEKAEKMTDYFFKLEKSQAKNRAMSATKLHDGSITRKPRQILQQQVDFYNKLYTKDQEIKFEYKNSPVQISVEHKTQLENGITLEELSSALKDTKNGKAPGLDGFSVDFLKVFWGRLKQTIHEALLHSVKIGRLFQSARRGVISLIPKENRDLLLVKHWRPICLLCVDFKLYSKVLANRLKSTLTSVVSNT